MASRRGVRTCLVHGSGGGAGRGVEVEETVVGDVAVAGLAPNQQLPVAAGFVVRPAVH